ncbi:MAG: hypothetical protein ACYCZK_08455 [Microbacteriaceae bacterium]
MKLIWLTRGMTWGFTFLRDGGEADPLPAYDEVFSGLDAQPEFCRRVGNKVALRFADPLKRKDRAGRVIPHDFVVFVPLADEIDSVEDGLRLVWPLVADEFARVWKLPKAPAGSG